jgi:hypothetical protein
MDVLLTSQVHGPAGEQLWSESNVHTENHFNLAARGPGMYKVWCALARAMLRGVAVHSGAVSGGGRGGGHLCTAYRMGWCGSMHVPPSLG